MNLITGFSVLLIFIALLTSYRLFVGPTVYDRLISLNMVGVIVTVILILISITSGLGVYIDIAISFLLLDFVGTIAFAKYLVGGEFE